MIPPRFLLLLAGVGTLLLGVPVSSARPPAVASEGRALELLENAARAARTLTYRGTQYVSTWRSDASSSQVADIRHTPTGGSVVSVRPTAGSDAPETSVTIGTDLDLRLLGLLDEHYDLSVAADDTCTGRIAHVVEAQRDDHVVGRFWLDADSGLMLRREVYDDAGRLVRSSVFAALTVSPVVAKDDAVDAAPRAVDAERFRREGWHVPTTLPGGLDLFDAKVREHDGKDVLHLSYSDGLSTLSLFAQRGRLGTKPMHGFAKQHVGRSDVWVRSSTPQRVVWGGDGRVFTLLSDAPPESVRAVVQALPHDKAPRTGLLARLGRGLSRLASWLNPFD